MTTDISTISSDGVEGDDALTRKCCLSLNLGECPEWIDGLETCATPGQGATPAQQSKPADAIATEETLGELVRKALKPRADAIRRSVRVTSDDLSVIVRSPSPPIGDGGETKAEQSCGGSGMAASFGQMWMPEGGVAANVRVAEQREMIALLRQALLDATGETDIVYAYAKRKEPLARVADAEHARAVAVATLSEQLDAANARVATLEAECVAWRKAEDWMFWDIGEPNDFAVSQREMSEDQFRLDAARAATGPIGGVH